MIAFCLDGVSCMSCMIPVYIQVSLVFVMRNVKSSVGMSKRVISNFTANTVQLIQRPLKNSTEGK